MKMIYVDTSSALKILLEEDGTAQVRGLFREAAQLKNLLVSSRLLRTEMLRIAYRESLDLDDVSKVLTYVNLVDVGRDILDLAGNLRFHVRTLDAVHLATASTLDGGQDEVHLLTHDARMRLVGAEMGLRIVA